MEIFYRAFLLFVVLLLVVKLLGNKQIKQLTLYDYVVGITIGSIGADTIISLDISVWDGVLGIILFGAFGYILNLLSSTFHTTEKLLEGVPLILFEKDHFMEENLSKAKLSPTQVLEQCRLKGCFDLKELDTAILEPSGDISVLLKENSQNLTKSDVKASVKKNSSKQTLCYSVITNGVIDEEELRKAKKTKKWLNDYLKKHHKTLQDVTLLTIDQNGKSTIY